LKKRGNVSHELSNVIAQRFIQRRDVKAVQLSGGAYSPDYQLTNRITGEKDPGIHGPLGFRLRHIAAHLEGKATYGHYVLDTESLCRVITFDVDLIDKPNGTWVKASAEDDYAVIEKVNPRELWADRNQKGARSWYKYQMKMLAHKLCDAVMKLDIPTAAAYSGNKGIHVYGFLGPTEAVEAHQAALLILDMMDEWEPLKGNHFFTHKNDDPGQGFKNFNVEVYPKQESLKEGQLGNLVRLPLGKNLKNPKDPTFFLDLTVPMAEFKPHPDPVKLLKEGDPFNG
jgi:hypothetical protein